MPETSAQPPSPVSSASILMGLASPTTHFVGTPRHSRRSLPFSLAVLARYISTGTRLPVGIYFLTYSISPPSVLRAVRSASVWMLKYTFSAGPGVKHHYVLRCSRIMGSTSDAPPWKKKSVTDDVNGVGSRLISTMLAPLERARCGRSAAG
jgi:hypothetical protein